MKILIEEFLTLMILALTLGLLDSVVESRS